VNGEFRAATYPPDYARRSALASALATERQLTMATMTRIWAPKMMRRRQRPARD
jgi:hypothetical protein